MTTNKTKNTISDFDKRTFKSKLQQINTSLTSFYKEFVDLKNQVNSMKEVLDKAKDRLGI